LNKITKWRFKKNIQNRDAKKMQRIEEERRRRGKVSRGKKGWKNSCGDSTMEERQPIYTGIRGVLAGW
jgi:hypothetical protein